MQHFQMTTDLIDHLPNNLVRFYGGAREVDRVYMDAETRCASHPLVTHCFYSTSMMIMVFFLHWRVMKITAYHLQNCYEKKAPITKLVKSSKHVNWCCDLLRCNFLCYNFLRCIFFCYNLLRCNLLCYYLLCYYLLRCNFICYHLLRYNLLC